MKASLNRRGVEASARLERIRRAAAQLLRERGYDGTRLDAVLQRSGGSKATLIKYFGGKQGLVLDVMSSEARRCVQQAEAASTGRDPARALSAFGDVVLRFYLTPDGQAGYRAVVAGGHGDARLARGYFERGEGLLVAALASRLRAWQAEGSARTPDPEGDAVRFLYLLRSGPCERALLGAQPGVPETRRRSHVRACVRLFLSGTGIPRRPPRRAPRRGTSAR